MENVPPAAEGRPPEISEADEIAALLTKRAHCQHNFRYCVITENKKTREDAMFAWCQHCGLGMRTIFIEGEQELS